MHESLLPERARPAYRLSPWKKHLDDKAGTLLASGYSPKTVGAYVDAWVAFVADYDGDAVLPTDVRGPEVSVFLDARWSAHPDMRRHVRSGLRHLLDGDSDLRALGWAREADSPLYEEHVPGYLAFARQHRGRRSSRAVEWGLRTFFAWLAGRGVEDIAEISAVELRSYLSSRSELKRSTVAEHASVLRGFFRYLVMSGVVRPGLVALIESPRLYRMSTPPPILDSETVEQILGAVDRTTALGKRDYAVLLLAARYGLRPCDIRTLRLDDIRWREQRMVLLQSKTQQGLELPLVEDVDRALVDYLRHGRPACDAREVFVRHVPPVVPFSKSHNLWDVMLRAFKGAGIEPPDGPRGLYLLRHSAATRMVGEGVPFDTISDVLGHASVDTTRIYAQVDMAGLRSVALSAEEVWA